MKTAIFNLCVGRIQPHWKYCLKSQHDYCEKYGIDHYASERTIVNWRYSANPAANFFFEKLQGLRLFSEGYDRVLYLDADILITPHAKNIFEEYPDPAKYYGYDESQEVGILGETMYGDEKDVMDRDPYVERVLSNTNHSFSWKKNDKGKYVYYNMGAMLLGKDAVDWLEDQEKLLSFKDCENIYDFTDQTYFNALIQKFNVPSESFDYSYNRMNLGGRDTENERYNANFIHYAGPCLYNVDGEFTEEKGHAAVLKDYEHLYSNE